MGLDEIRPGKDGVVTEISVDKALHQRLTDFGFVPGTRVQCCYRSPGGQVTAIRCRGTVIALRTRDLKNIQVNCV